MSSDTDTSGESNADKYFPHAYAEPWRGRYRVVLTSKTGAQQVVRSGLSKKAARMIAVRMIAASLSVVH